MSQKKTPVFYVIAKDAVKNELTVGVGRETLRQKFEVGELNWLGGETVSQCHVRIRHGGKLIPAEIIKRSDLLMLKLLEGQRGIASGQSAVFYKDGIVLGGGVIQ